MVLPPPPLTPPPAAPPAIPSGPSNWHLGIIIILCAQLSSSIGILFLKRSTDIETNLPVWKRWRLMLGLLNTVVILAITDTWAFAIMPLSMIAPFAGLTIVLTALLSATGWFGIKETLTLVDMGATALVLVGVTIVSVFGPDSDFEPTLADIPGLFAQPQFIAYGSVTGSIGLFWLGLLVLPCCRHRRPSGKRASATLFAAFASASCAGFTQVFMKTISVAVHEMVAGSPVWRVPITWISIVGIGISGPAQFYLLNTTLASASVALAVPAYQSLVIMSTIASGAVFFDELSLYSPAALGANGCAVVLVIVGLAVLSHRAQQAKELEGERITPRPMSGFDPEAGSDGGVQGLHSPCALLRVARPLPAADKCASRAAGTWSSTTSPRRRRGGGSLARRRWVGPAPARPPSEEVRRALEAPPSRPTRRCRSPSREMRAPRPPPRPPRPMCPPRPPPPSACPPHCSAPRWRTDRSASSPQKANRRRPRRRARFDVSADQPTPHQGRVPRSSATQVGFRSLSCAGPRARQHHTNSKEGRGGGGRE